MPDPASHRYFDILLRRETESSCLRKSSVSLCIEGRRMSASDSRLETLELNGQSSCPDFAEC